MVAILLLLNLLGFVLMAIDKRKAVRKERRIREVSLFLCALLGGALGEIFAMYLFHHKNQKPLFYIGLPAIFIIELFLVAVFKL